MSYFKVKCLCYAAVAVAAIAMSTVSYAQGGSCHDPWINSAYNQLYHRAPSGSNTTGECNILLYGGGHWTTFADLENKIIAVRGRPTAVQAPAPAPAPALITFKLDSKGNLVTSSGGFVASAGSFNLVNTSGSLLNPAAIVAAGGGNIVAAGGGNMRSVQSVGGRPTYVVR